MTSDLKKLERLAEKQGGVKVWEVSNGHIKVQADGRAVVNYWPGSKNRTAHMEGTPKGIVRCDPADVIAIAMGGPKCAPSAADVRTRGDVRKPAGVKIGEDEYAFRGTDFDEKLANIPADNGSAPWA